MKKALKIFAAFCILNATLANAWTMKPMKPMRPMKPMKPFKMSSLHFDCHGAINSALTSITGDQEEMVMTFEGQEYLLDVGQVASQANSGKEQHALTAEGDDFTLRLKIKGHAGKAKVKWPGESKKTFSLNCQVE